jgi:hypothetical protein
MTQRVRISSSPVVIFLDVHSQSVVAAVAALAPLKEQRLRESHTSHRYAGMRGCASPLYPLRSVVSR